CDLMEEDWTYLTEHLMDDYGNLYATPKKDIITLPRQDPFVRIAELKKSAEKNGIFMMHKGINLFPILEYISEEDHYNLPAEELFERKIF
ncbi:hypothetical protein, partial [Poseidonibacter sp.]|uniref:hypothetical protein n=1 Tax=Poseidonibacter sp. TaxID=2321188 RepID=UPI003C74BFF0